MLAVQLRCAAVSMSAPPVSDTCRGSMQLRSSLFGGLVIAVFPPASQFGCHFVRSRLEPSNSSSNARRKVVGTPLGTVDVAVEVVVEVVVVAVVVALAVVAVAVVAAVVVVVVVVVDGGFVRFTPRVGVV